jgi:hypothetical protein
MHKLFLSLFATVIVSTVAEQASPSAYVWLTGADLRAKRTSIDGFAILSGSVPADGGEATPL